MSSADWRRGRSKGSSAWEGLPIRLSVFRKTVLMLILLLVPIWILYSLSNRTSTEVVRRQIESSNLSQLMFLMDQMDTNIEQLSMFPILLSYDPNIREFLDHRPPKLYDALNAEYRIIEKLGLQSVSNGWRNDLSLILPQEGRAIHSNAFVQDTDEDLRGAIFKRWTYAAGNRGTDRYFVREIGEPYSAERKPEAGAVFRVRFHTHNLTDMLDVYKIGKNNDPFLYFPGEQPVLNSTASPETVRELIEQLPLPSADGTDYGQQLIRLNNELHLVSYVKSKQLDWYLIDYTPYQSVIAPITKQRNFFYAILGLLLLVAVVATFILYRNLQRPLVQLIAGVQRIKRGDYSARVKVKAKNEFDYLGFQFNEMAERIQLLIEDVYAERLRSREATLKQLQSQINPHFLYNSLFFIANAAMLNDRDAVVKMAQSLASFCRYSTRVENQFVTLREELEFVRNYLTIQNLRMDRLSFEIDVPNSMLELTVPRLILQPIVENAIVHGLEPSPDGGMITITGKQDDRFHWIFVEDDGVGMTPAQLRKLTAELELPLAEEIGTGTWNVHQRLKYQFGGGSGLSFEPLPHGGLRTTIRWRREPAPENGNLAEVEGCNS